MTHEDTSNLVPCACGCGQLFVSRYLKKRMTRFIHGHNKRSTLDKQFWDKMDRSGECWIWQGYRNPKGYGQIRITSEEKTTRAVLTHRLSYELTYGPIPNGKYVCHRCDNPSCCRPDHLFIGTIADNQQDMVLKGRTSRGEHHYHTTLKSTDIIAIRTQYAAGSVSQADLGRMFGVHAGTIGAIIARRTWKHVP